MDHIDQKKVGFCDLPGTLYAPVSKILSVKGTLIAEREAFMNQI